MASTSTPTEQPILPPTVGGSRAGIAHLQALVSSNPTQLTLTGGDDEALLPSEVVDALRQTLAALARDQAVTIMPTATLLTTQQAADILGVSRPTIVKILEAGEIPFVTPGRHRRIQLVDLVAYQQQCRQQTAEALDELMQDSAQHYLESSSADNESAAR